MLQNILIAFLFSIYVLRQQPLMDRVRFCTYTIIYISLSHQLVLLKGEAMFP